MTSRPIIGTSRRELLKMFGFAALSLTSPRSAAAPSRSAIYLKPLGPPPRADAVAAATRAIESLYGFEVRVTPSMALPRSAFYAPRRRYRAEVLLDALVPSLPHDGLRLIGMTSVDISTSKPPHADWGILGIATVGGPTGVVSSFRCARRARNSTHVAERFAKTTVHELGHALGLPHCIATSACIMADAGGSVLTTDGETDLCGPCRERLARLGFDLHASTGSPWKT